MEDYNIKVLVAIIAYIEVGMLLIVTVFLWRYYKWLAGRSRCLEDTLERFHIHTETSNQNHLNDNLTIFPNPIFDALT
jgi:hypothetical protein